VSRTRIHRRLPRLATGAALLALGLGGLTACGGSSTGSAAGSTTTPSAATSSATESSASASMDPGGTSESETLTAT
jgi:plastocyanin